MRPRMTLVVALAFALVAAACTGGDTDASANAGADAGPGAVLQPDEPVGVRVGSYAGTEPAPEFPAGLDWLNVERPLSLADLRGKVVLLDFWTYGCINCIHIIPELERLEAEYAEELVVIGVHSAKFTNEGETANISDVIARYGLEHPVVNDKDFEVWSLWGAEAWPTVVLIDPAGNVVGGYSGEGIYPVFQPVIDSLVEEFDTQGRIDHVPLEVSLERDRRPQSVLSFPGKVLADVDGGRLFVADTNHHRIVVADLTTGEILDVAGAGTPRYGDGTFEGAGFDQPQGMALAEDGTTLYVADTGNHAVRGLDLNTRTVRTVLGTGRQAPRYPPPPGTAPNVPISSPWDLALSDGMLYIAMAGSHQIWTLALATAQAAWFAGSGRESTRNGPRLSAGLAQPSAVTILPDGTVAFADSESSSIRFAEPGTDGVTGVLAGSDRDLFDFGDEDGFGTTARLQHPLGLDVGAGELWVADTYNSKIKRLDPETGEIVTFAGGDQGWSDGFGPDASFSEPGGVSYGDRRLYVADTNNNAIRVIDLESGETTTLVLFGIERFDSEVSSEVPVVDVGDVVISGGTGELLLDIALPIGFKFNDLAPLSLEWESEETRFFDASISVAEPPMPLASEAVFSDGSIAGDLTVYYCSVGSESLCLIDQVRLTARVVTTAAGPTSATIRYSIDDPGL